MATMGKPTTVGDHGARSKDGVKKKRRRIAFVPRIAVGTAMFTVVPACIVSSCATASCDGGDSDGPYGPQYVDMYAAYDSPYREDASVDADATSFDGDSDASDVSATDAPEASDADGDIEGGDATDEPGDADDGAADDAG